MKKIGELMAEMGFRKEASNSVKEAFIKHLIRASEDVHIRTPSEKREIEKNNIPQITETLARGQSGVPAKVGETEQLSFDFNEVS